MKIAFVVQPPHVGQLLFFGSLKLDPKRINLMQKRLLKRPFPKRRGGLLRGSQSSLANHRPDACSAFKALLLELYRIVGLDFLSGFKAWMFAFGQASDLLVDCFVSFLRKYHGAKWPNDPKLSDRRGWRDRCVAGERRRQEAAGVTAAPVRCSAWLGHVRIGLIRIALVSEGIEKCNAANKAEMPCSDEHSVEKKHSPADGTLGNPRWRTKKPLKSDVTPRNRNKLTGGEWRTVPEKATWAAVRLPSIAVMAKLPSNEVIK